MNKDQLKTVLGEMLNSENEDVRKISNYVLDNVDELSKSEAIEIIEDLKGLYLIQNQIDEMEAKAFTTDVFEIILYLVKKSGFI